MKKRLAFLLLLLPLGLVGCGESEQAPTLADSLQGKRIHFQFQDQEESRELWLQLGDNNQGTIEAGKHEMSMSYAINETKLIMDHGNNAGKNEIRFSKPDLAVGDQVIIFLSRGERTLVGSITKIEAAGRIKEVVNPETDPTAVPNAEPDPGDPTPPEDE